MWQLWQVLTRLFKKGPFFGKVDLYQTTTVSENQKTAIFTFSGIVPNLYHSRNCRISEISGNLGEFQEFGNLTMRLSTTNIETPKTPVFTFSVIVLKQDHFQKLAIFWKKKLRPSFWIFDIGWFNTIFENQNAWFYFFCYCVKPVPFKNSRYSIVMHLLFWISDFGWIHTAVFTTF